MCKRWIFAALLAAAGCSFDAGGARVRNDGDVTPPADARSADAAAPDASTIACTSNADCTAPRAPCLVAGTCDETTKTCDFPSKDCAAAASDCRVGVCEPATGDCVARPAFEGQACGAGETCGEFGVCGEFDAEDPCDETGSRSRTCSVFTCVAGSCVATERIDAEACGRDRDGVTCSDTTCGEFGECGSFADVCDESGSRQRACTAFACRDGACVGAPFVSTMACVRSSTEGVVCGMDECPAFSECGGFLGVCDETGQQSRFCTRYRCAEQACRPESFNQTRGCVRNTDGQICGHIDRGDTCLAVVCVDGECPMSQPGECP